MKPERRPSKPGRSSFFSRLAFFLSALAVERACRFSLRLWQRATGLSARTYGIISLDLRDYQLGLVRSLPRS